MSDKTHEVNPDALKVLISTINQGLENGDIVIPEDVLDQYEGKVEGWVADEAQKHIQNHPILNDAALAALASTEDNETTSETPFLDIVRYGYAVKTGNPKMLDELKAKDHIVGTAAQGGYLAPTIPDNEFVNLTIRDSIMMTICRQKFSPTNALTMPTLTQTGGLNGYWVAESTDADGGSTKTTEETMVFGQLTLTMYALRANAVVSNEVLEDSANFGVDIETEIRADLSDAFGAAVDFGVIHGNATAGEANVNSLLTGLETLITSNVLNAGGAPSYDDMVALMVPEDNTRGVLAYVMAPAARRALITAKDNDGRPIWETGLATGDIPAILGNPVHLNRNVKKTLGGGAETAIFSGAFGTDAIIGIKRGVSFLINPYRFADYGSTQITAFARFGFTVTAENRFAILGGVTV